MKAPYNFAYHLRQSNLAVLMGIIKFIWLPFVAHMFYSRFNDVMNIHPVSYGPELNTTIYQFIYCVQLHTP